MDKVMHFVVHKSRYIFNGSASVSYPEGFCSMGFP